MGDIRLECFLLAGSPKACRPFHYTQLKHKGNGRSQTSSLGVLGPVPTEAALSSFTMNCSPIVLDTTSFVAQDNQRRVRGRGTPMINKLQDHLLSCMELEKRNLFESPALVRDFLWAGGLLDLV
ncbi:hypothetical protein AVEN_249487-1 [Araneus ventricosus]|uniref:Uncharacterized protein n=1 Tax=Araneus ventricosus TaxID=182803 RepID=A0A4Y2KQE5_ARAVE|nr:hypothetical protein AVEN_249487-1 [Araneus ventricosus]